MAEDINRLIVNVLTEWGEKVVNDVKAEIDSKILHNGGQASALSGSVNYKVINKGGEISWQLTMNPYWEVIEKGRGAGKKAPPSKPIKDWLRQNESLVKSLDKVYAKVTVKAKKSGALTKRTKSLKDVFDKKLSGYAFMIARSIGKKGTKPRPFIHKVVNESRIDELKQMLAPILKQYYILEFKNI